MRSKPQEGIQELFRETQHPKAEDTRGPISSETLNSANTTQEGCNSRNASGQISTERPSHSYFSPYQLPLELENSHGPLREAQRVAMSSCWPMCYLIRVVRKNENLQQRLWVNQNQDFMWVWLNLRGKITPGKSQRDKKVSRERPSGTGVLRSDQGHFSSRCSESRGYSQRPERVRHLGKYGDNQKTADEPATASPPRRRGCITHFPLCYPDAT